MATKKWAKKISGKQYKFYSIHTTKTGANKMAKPLKESGYGVRILKEKTRSLAKPYNYVHYFELWKSVKKIFK